MTLEERIIALNKLVDEVTKDHFDVIEVKAMLANLNIPYHEDPLQLLNNVLKGIHEDSGNQGPKNEQSI